MGDKKQYITPTVSDILNDVPHHNYYAVMEFRTENELGLSYDNTTLLNTKNHYFRNGVKAMEEFIHNPNQNISLASGETVLDLKKDMIKNIKDINKQYK